MAQVPITDTLLRSRQKKPWWSYYYFHRYLYLLLIPALVYYFVFHYLPMYGLLIAFKDFNIMKGILRSPWAGLKHFQYIFGLDKFKQIFFNTLSISLLRLIFGFPAPIIAALLINEIMHRSYKRTIQTVIYLPHFISWVVLGGILTNLLSQDGGMVNELLNILGGRPIGFLTDERYFVGTLVTSMIWREYGWNTIIYMAALAGIDPQLYEAAIVDGANRWKRTWHITLPCIKGTMAVILILRLGQLMNAGFEQIFVLYHPAVYRVSDIIDTYVFRIGLTQGRFSMATAVGLFKSIINLALMVAANRISRSAIKHGIY